MTLIDADPHLREVIGCAIKVHRMFGPGLIDSVYEECLCHERALAGIAFVQQQKLPVVHKGHCLDCDLRMDIVVEQWLVLEINSVRMLHPVHEAQLHTYLKLSGLRVGLLMNSNLVRLVDGMQHNVG